MFAYYGLFLVITLLHYFKSQKKKVLLDSATCHDAEFLHDCQKYHFMI